MALGGDRAQPRGRGFCASSPVPAQLLPQVRKIIHGHSLSAEEERVPSRDVLPADLQQSDFSSKILSFALCMLVILKPPPPLFPHQDGVQHDGGPCNIIALHGIQMLVCLVS